MNGRVVIIRGDARALPLPDESVDLLITSPPYFGLRAYTDNGEIYPGQIGSEATPAAYVAALVECTAEWMRVLKPAGSLFVNLGDKYVGSGGNVATSPAMVRFVDRRHHGGSRTLSEAEAGARTKSLLGLPWRYALACTDQLGLILRAEIIWAKPNGLPESVTDRVRRAHEQVFHFTRQPRYYTAIDEIREAGIHAATHKPGSTTNRTRMNGGDGVRGYGFQLDAPNPLGKLPGSVWNIPSQPLTVPPSLGVDHFAAFPMELPRRLVLGWSPPGICTTCGEGRRPVVDVALSVSGGQELAHGSLRNGEARQRRLGQSSSLGMTPAVTTTGYACGCGIGEDPGWAKCSWCGHAADYHRYADPPRCRLCPDGICTPKREPAS